MQAALGNHLTLKLFAALCLTTCLFVSFALGLVMYVWELVSHGGFLWQYDTEAVFAYLWSILCLSILSLLSGIGILAIWRKLKRSARNG
jgi:hypothetical protein